MAPLDPLNRRPAPPEHATAPKRPALALIYQEHWQGVLSSLRYFGVPARDLPDVAQDIFIRVHASLPSYDPTRPLKPWLRTITYRSAQDYLKSAHARRTRLAPVEDVETMDTAPSPERRTLIVEAERVFTDLLQDLNEDQRIAYLMSIKDGCSIPEIAEALGEPENTVRSRLHRAHVAFDAALARRRTAEERRQSALLPLLTPAALVEAVRQGGDAEPGLKDLVWSRLVRVLGLGIIGKLASLSGWAIVACAALLATLGGVVGASLHAALERPSSETILRAEPVTRASAPGPMGAPPEAVPSTRTTVASAPIGSATTAGAGPTASAGELDAGAPDLAAQLRAETAILGRAREAMEGGHYDVVLRELNRHERIFPFGQLSEQRKEMKRVVLAELRGRDAGAR